MKKLVAGILCICILLAMTSCGYSKKKQDKVTAMFDSFDNSQNFIILTHHQLVVGDRHYDLSEIKYNGRKCNIICLEESGFYSYTYSKEDLAVEFLYTSYEDFDAVVLGVDTLPSKIINSFWGDNCFWFRMHDPNSEESKQMYYSWDIDTKQAATVESEEIAKNYEYSIDNNRSKHFSFQKADKIFNDHIEVTDNETNITKRIDKSVLKTFEEGKQIKKNALEPSFDIAHVFEKNGDIYFISYYGLEPWGSPCYYCVSKWNFETEESEFYASIYFDEFQDSIVDMYII